MPGNDRPRKATTRSWPSSGCAPGSGRTQSASRRVSLGKIPNDCTHGRATNPSEADTVVGGREASTCRCDASWPRQANWVKITPSAPAISNCSQELSRRINPGHRTTQRGQRTSEFNGKSGPRGKRSWTVRSRTRETSTGPEAAAPDQHGDPQLLSRGCVPNGARSTLKQDRQERHCETHGEKDRGHQATTLPERFQ